MASNFKPEQALQVVKQKSNVNSENSAHSNQPSALYKDYFSLESGEPIPFDQLTKRIKKRFSDIDRSSVFSALDLFFLHSNWQAFYKREDSFSKFIKETLLISRTHAYAILASVKLLNEYYSHKGSDAPSMGTFLDEVSASIEDIGIKKLSIISGIKDEQKKFTLVDKLIGGEEITADELEAKVERKKTVKPNLNIQDGNIISAGVALLHFSDGVDEAFRTFILKATAKYLKKTKI